MVRTPADQTGWWPPSRRTAPIARACRGASGGPPAAHGTRQRGLPGLIKAPTRSGRPRHFGIAAAVRRILVDYARKRRACARARRATIGRCRCSPIRRAARTDVLALRVSTTWRSRSQERDRRAALFGGMTEAKSYPQGAVARHRESRGRHVRLGRRMKGQRWIAAMGAPAAIAVPRPPAADRAAFVVAHCRSNRAAKCSRCWRRRRRSAASSPSRWRRRPARPIPIRVLIGVGEWAVYPARRGSDATSPSR
jgi:hypothetical protein